ncbi:MAG TPA: hypothetical protein VFR23_11650 [Jiangellaceae bacterium]|nr:hypothetical protein [Jiangellaceae bacterium]
MHVFAVPRLVAIIHDLVKEGIGLLLVEQSLPVAVEPAPRIAIRVTGWIVNEVDAAMLGADATLQHRYLGVGARVEGARDR